MTVELRKPEIESNLPAVHLCLVLVVYLPVPSEMFPHDRHHVLHHTSGRPHLVQGAVLVVDPLQSKRTLKVDIEKKSCTTGTG